LCVAQCHGCNPFWFNEVTSLAKKALLYTSFSLANICII